MKRVISAILILMMLGCVASTENVDMSVLESPEIYAQSSPFQPCVYEGHTYNIFPASNMSWVDMKSKC